MLERKGPGPGREARRYQAYSGVVSDGDRLEETQRAKRHGQLTSTRRDEWPWP
jgi:hypothetical protein